MNEIINKYRCDHSFDRANCAFCSPQQEGVSHFGGHLVDWDLDDGNPLMGELESRDEILIRRAREKEAKDLAKQAIKDAKRAELQKSILEYEETEQVLIDNLPF